MTKPNLLKDSDLFQPGHSFGKFYILQLIGEGGTSRVYKAIQQPINRVVALKVPNFANCEEVLSPDEFLAEAMMMARLEHANIIRIYDFGVIDDIAFICMEYIEGIDILELIQHHFPLPEVVVLSIVEQILNGLQVAHAQGVLHRDLSPQNIFVSTQGFVKLGDFGMAGKKIAADGKSKIVGTPAFLSPEHVDKLPCYPGSDLFSMASVIFFLGTGKLLFDPGIKHEHVEDIFRQIRKARYNPPLDRLKILSPESAQLTLQALTGEATPALIESLPKIWLALEVRQEPVACLRHFLINRKGISQQEIRKRYLYLREQGEHKEAIELLESAISKSPQDISLQELLLQPWAKSNNAWRTVGIDEPVTSKKNYWVPSKLLFSGLVVLVALILAMIFGFFIFHHKTESQPSALKIEVMVPKAPAKESLVVDQAIIPNKPPEVINENNTSEVTESSKLPSKKEKMQIVKKDTVLLEAPTPNHVTPSLRIVEGKKDSALLTENNEKKTEFPARLKVESLDGVDIVLNDSIHFTTPSISEGWILPAGLLKISLSHVNFTHPIRSTLFVSSGTIYTLQINANGGYKVIRNKP